jgi:aspartate aminotransferase
MINRSYQQMSHELAARVQRIKPSQTLAVAARADELVSAGKSIISLSVGEPDFDTPDFIKNAAIEAIKKGYTKYTAVDGTPGLKKAIINKFKRDNHLNYEPSQILVSCGAKHSLYNLFAALLNSGDEVIIPAPYWVSYPDMVKLVDATPVIVKADATQHFKISPTQLEAAITPKTRLVILNSPSNPSGMAYTKAELHALGEVLLRHPNIVVVSDDIYEHTLWSKEPFANIVMACPELVDRAVIVNGVSKSYAMTGWRIGYAAGPAKLIAAMKKIQSQSTSNPCSISQFAAETALNGDQNCIVMMTRAYKERHDFLLNELKNIPGTHSAPCDGTFYLMVSVEELIKKAGLKDDIELSELLLNEAGIALVPGSAFGMEGHVRFSYATSMDNLREAMKRLKKWVETL